MNLQAISLHPSLLSLNLAANPLGDGGLRSVASALLSNCVLTELNLVETEARAAGIHA